MWEYAAGKQTADAAAVAQALAPSKRLHTSAVGVCEVYFTMRISKVLAVLCPWLLTRQSLFVPPDVFRGLSQHFLLRCIRTCIQCGTWRTARPALLKVSFWHKASNWTDHFHVSRKHSQCTKKRVLDL